PLTCRSTKPGSSVPPIRRSSAVGKRSARPASTSAMRPSSTRTSAPGTVLPSTTIASGRSTVRCIGGEPTVRSPGVKRRTAAARLLLFAAGGALAGALGVLLVERPYEPLPPLHAEDYGFTRQSGDAFVIDPQRILSVPFAFPDFDLFAQVTLSEGAELDVVLRRVEPQLAGDPFHGRWVLARLSTRQAGPVVRSREAAVFADDVPGGHRLAPGRAATLTVMARGRRLRANLAGVWYELEASDAHGALAFVARHGPVEIDLLEVHNLGRPLRLLPFAWGAILGAGFGLLAAALGARAIRAVFATLAVPAFGYAAALLITAFHLPQVEPRTPALLALGLAGAPLAV